MIKWNLLFFRFQADGLWYRQKNTKIESAHNLADNVEHTTQNEKAFKQSNRYIHALFWHFVLILWMRNSFAIFFVRCQCWVRRQNERDSLILWLFMSWTWLTTLLARIINLTISFCHFTINSENVVEWKRCCRPESGVHWNDK